MGIDWRKRIFLIMPGFFQAVAAAPSPATGGGTIVTSNLINYLDFSNTSCYSGSGSTINDLVDTLTYSTQGVTFESGVANGSFNFDGINDYIFASSDRSLSGNFSVGVWLNVSSFNDGSWLTFQNTISDGLWHFMGSNLKARNVVNSGAVDSNATLSTSTWYYILFVFNDTSNIASLYINGSLDKTQSYSQNFNVANERLCLGARSRGSNTGATQYFFSGNIGEFHLYNTDITSTDVTTNWNATKTRYGY